MTIIAAADGSALGNPGPAGWAWYVDETCWAAGGWPHGTNNMGELTAVLELLRATADAEDELLVLCDSTYAIKSITEWMPGWKKRGWKKRDGKPVLNVEIMQALDEAMTGRRVRFEWVKGHSGHALNDAADRLANAAATAYRDSAEVQTGPGFGGRPTAPLDPTPEAEPEPEWDLFSQPDADEAQAGGEPLLPELSDLPALDQVVALERALLTPEVRSDTAQVAALLHPEFTEIGASGQVYNREGILDRIAPLPAQDTELEVLSVSEVGDGLVLVLWRQLTEDAAYLRSSLWQREAGGWRMRHHQGTPSA